MNAVPIRPLAADPRNRRSFSTGGVNVKSKADDQVLRWGLEQVAPSNFNPTDRILIFLVFFKKNIFLEEEIKYPRRFVGNKVQRSTFAFPVQ